MLDKSVDKRKFQKSEKINVYSRRHGAVLPSFFGKQVLQKVKA
jgi:hypothetical protein